MIFFHSAQAILVELTRSFEFMDVVTVAMICGKHLSTVPKLFEYEDLFIDVGLISASAVSAKTLDHENNYWTALLRLVRGHL